MRIGELQHLPDFPCPWTYTQIPSACIFSGVPDYEMQTGAAKNGDLVLLYNGGGPGLQESDWITIYPKETADPQEPPVYPRFSNLWYGTSDELETAGPKVCWMPFDEWWGPEHHGKWLVSWSGSWARDWGVQKPYRVWCGLGICPHLGGTPSHWDRRQEAIFSSKNVPAQPPPNAWWPNGTWAVAPLVIGPSVFVVVRDNSWGAPPKQCHLIYQIDPSTLQPAAGPQGQPAEIILSDWVPQSWLNDVGLGADGHLYGLDGQSAGRLETGGEVREYVSEGKYPTIGTHGKIVMVPSGKVYKHWDEKTWTFQAGYLKDRSGVIAEPRLVLGTVGDRSNDWTKRGVLRLCYWDESSDSRYHRRLIVPPLKFGDTR